MHVFSILYMLYNTLSSVGKHSVHPLIIRFMCNTCTCKCWVRVNNHTKIILAHPHQRNGKKKNIVCEVADALLNAITISENLGYLDLYGNDSFMVQQSDCASLLLGMVCFDRNNVFPLYIMFCSVVMSSIMKYF